MSQGLVQRVRTVALWRYPNDAASGKCDLPMSGCRQAFGMRTDLPPERCCRRGAANAALGGGVTICRVIYAFQERVVL